MLCLPIRPSARAPAARGYTILELLTTLAFLVVVLGMMVSLARYVRASSAQELTRRLLAELDEALARSTATTRPTTVPAWDQSPPDPLEAAQPPPLPRLPPPPAPPAQLDEAQFQQYVLRASVPHVRQLLALARASVAPAEVSRPTRSAPAAKIEDAAAEQVVRDAWGNPIAYLPAHHPGIGMAPQNRPFFVSAGPDGRFLTREDNLYSYEQIRLAPRPAGRSAGGQGE